jgi:hypothetical protein
MLEFQYLSQSEKRAFAIFLKMQIRDMEKKIRCYKDQLDEIATFGIDINDLPDYGWIQVNAKED